MSMPPKDLAVVVHTGWARGTGRSTDGQEQTGIATLAEYTESAVLVVGTVVPQATKGRALVERLSDGLDRDRGVGGRVGRDEARRREKESKSCQHCESDQRIG